MEKKWILGTIENGVGFTLESKDLAKKQLHSGFGDNKNVISVNMHPHKEKLYLSEKSYAYKYNALLMGLNHEDL